MSRLKALLHVARPSNRNTQQPYPVSGRGVLHVASTSRNCNATVQPNGVAELHVALAKKRNAQLLDRSTRRELFTFAPPGDPANDDEALKERVAIMIEGGMDESRALQEARWHTDRERAWRAFIRNAGRILAAPESQHGAFISIYQKEAARRYGASTGTDMAKSLASWVTARRVH